VSRSVIPTGALRLASSIAMRSGGTCWLDLPDGRPGRETYYTNQPERTVY